MTNAPYPSHEERNHRPLWFIYVATFALLMWCWSCTPVCKTDLDCDFESEPTQCVDGSCEPLEVDLGPSCENDADCEQETGTFSCVEGTCAMRPQCQQIFGTFDYALSCGDNPVQKGPAQLTTSECVPTLSMTIGGDTPANNVEIVLPRIETTFSSAELSLGTTSNVVCEESSWTSTSSALYVNCLNAVELNGCEIGLFPAERDLSPCLLSDSEGEGCEENTTCQDVAGHSQVGVCQ